MSGCARVEPGGRKQHGSNAETEPSETGIAPAESSRVDAEQQREGDRKSFMLKIGRDVADRWHLRQLNRGGFVAPKCTGVSCADRQEKQHGCRKQNRDEQLESSEEVDLA